MSHSDTYLMALLLALPCVASGGEADVISARAIRTVVQDQDSALAVWLHGIVHILDGDLDNARYWYRKAGRVFPGPGAIQDAWIIGLQARKAGLYSANVIFAR